MDDRFKIIESLNDLIKLQEFISNPAFYVLSIISW